MVWGSDGGIDDRPHQEIAQKDKPGTRLVAKTVGEKVSRSMERGSGDTMRISLGARFMGPTESGSTRWATVRGSRLRLHVFKPDIAFDVAIELEQTTLHSVK